MYMYVFMYVCICKYLCMYVCTSAAVHYCDPCGCVESHFRVRRGVDPARLGVGGEHSETGRDIQGQESGMYVCMYIYMGDVCTVYVCMYECSVKYVCSLSIQAFC